MNRSASYSFVFLFAIALSTTPIECSMDDSRLASLTVEAAGANRVIAFHPWVHHYTVGTTEGIDTIIVQANAASTAATIAYDLFGAIPESGSLGVGMGEVTFTIPTDTPLTLSIDVTDGASTQTYTVDINRSCGASVDCDDGNTCSAVSCNLSATCDIEQLADSTPCDRVSSDDGLCNAGECINNTQVVSFEAFEPAQQGQLFGVELASLLEGFEWAYPDAAKIADSSCTVATATTCWGSWSVSDSSADGVHGASGDNWLRARSANQGKGAKITKSSGFIFRSMMLFTRDQNAYPAFVEQVEVTARTASAPSTDITTTIALQPETWIEVTADDLGVSATNLTSIWFNTDVSSPNAGKFGLDNFTVLIN